MVCCTLIAFATASCDLDYNPVDSYSDVTEGVTETEEKPIFSTVQDAENAILTLHKKFSDRQEHWYVDKLLIGDAHSDNAYVGTTGAEVVPYETNSIEGSNSVLERDWNRFLEDIAAANRIIVGCDKLEGLSEAQKGKFQSQAKIFRAMVMFDMARIWGRFPVITTVGGDITEDNVEDMYPTYFPPQNTIEEAFTQIETDLTEALSNAYTPTTDATDKTILTKSVARAMLAKVYAEKPLRDYSKVVKYADELAADGFDLVEDFSDLWDYNSETSDCRVRNTKESILEAQFPKGAGNWCTWMFGRQLDNWDASFTWAKWITPSRDLVKLYQNQGDTERYEQSIVWYECGWSNYYPANNYAFMYKCRSSFNSIIYLRYADILLLKAEALIMGENPDLGAAADIIDRVRQRAGLGKLDASIRNDKDALLQAYLDERRMELAFEGQRWYDLCRLDKVEEVMNAVYAKDSGRHAQAYPFNEDSYLLAIPQSAIDQNSNLTQNPGY